MSPKASVHCFRYRSAARNGGLALYSDGSAALASWLVMALMLLGCEGGASRVSAERSESVVAEVGAAPASLLEATALRNAVAKLRAKAGERARSLKLTIEPERVVLQAEALNERGVIHQYEYRGGRVHGPQRVVLRGDGELEENLFDLSEARLEAVPALGRAAIQSVDAAHGQVESIVLRRHLPHDEALRFRVFVKSPLLDGQLDGDAQGNPLPR